MAYAFCPVCRTCFRYRVESPRAPSWLKHVARSVGRGEQAAVFCYGCWLPLRIGKIVTIIHPPYAKPDIGEGAKGMVVDINTQDNGVTTYEVDGLEEVNGFVWRHAFTRRQLKADDPHTAQTARLVLSSHEH